MSTNKEAPGKGKWRVFLLVIALVVVVAIPVIAYGVHVIILRESADIGIPGVRTSYSVRLRNYTATPITFEGVQMPGGYLASGVWYHHAIEKWDPQSRRWKQVVDVNPLAIGSFPVIKRRVWPGGTLYPAPWEAIAARDGFRKADRARFVIFSSLRPPNSSGQMTFYSPAFQIEEEPARRGGS